MMDDDEDDVKFGVGELKFSATAANTVAGSELKETFPDIKYVSGGNLTTGSSSSSGEGVSGMRIPLVKQHQHHHPQPQQARGGNFSGSSASVGSLAMTDRGTSGASLSSGGSSNPLGAGASPQLLHSTIRALRTQRNLAPSSSSSSPVSSPLTRTISAGTLHNDNNHPNSNNNTNSLLSGSSTPLRRGASTTSLTKTGSGASLTSPTGARAGAAAGDQSPALSGGSSPSLNLNGGTPAGGGDGRLRREPSDISNATSSNGGGDNNNSSGNCSKERSRESFDGKTPTRQTSSNSLMLSSSLSGVFDRSHRLSPSGVAAAAATEAAAAVAAAAVGQAHSTRTHNVQLPPTVAKGGSVVHGPAPVAAGQKPFWSQSGHSNLFLRSDSPTALSHHCSPPSRDLLLLQQQQQQQLQQQLRESVSPALSRASSCASSVSSRASSADGSPSSSSSLRGSPSSSSSLRPYPPQHYRYDRIRSLSRGCSGEVDIVVEKGTKNRYARKLIGHRGSAQLKRLAHKDVEMLANVAHPNIAAFHENYDTDHKGGATVLLMEYIEGTTLATLLQKRRQNRERFTHQQIFAIFAQLALAVDYLAKHNVMHRDLKSANVVIKHSGLLKLVDFGFAVRSVEANEERLGTPFNASPESWNVAEPCGCASDCWSLGVILFELATLTLPFPGRATQEVKEKILRDPVVVPKSVGAETTELLYGLLQKDQKKRWTIREAIQRSPSVQQALLEYFSVAETLHEEHFYFLLKCHLRELGVPALTEAVKEVEEAAAAASRGGSSKQQPERAKKTLK